MGGDNFWILCGRHSCYEGGHRAHEGVPQSPPPTRENPDAVYDFVILSVPKKCTTLHEHCSTLKIDI